MQGYYQQRSNLPVDPENINRMAIASATPYLGDQFQNQLGNLADFVVPLIDGLIIEIQNQAGKNNLRTFAFNFWSQNGYRNDGFASLVLLFAMHVESVAAQYGNGANIIGIIEGEAPGIVEMASSYLAKDFPEIFSYLPREAEPKIMETSGRWAALVRQLNLTFSGGGGGYGRGGGLANQRQSGMGFNGRRDQGNQPQRDYSDLRPSWERQGTQQNNAQQPRVGLNRPPQASPQPSPAPVREQPTSGYGALKNMVSNMAAGEDLPTIRAATQSQPQAPVATQRRPEGKPLDHVDMGDGRWLGAAVLAATIPKFGPSNQPMVYDRETQVLFYVYNKDGVPTEEFLMDKASLKEKGFDVDYLEHELKESLRKMFRGNKDIYSREQRGAPIEKIRALMPSATGAVAVQPTQERREELNEMTTAPRQITRPIQDASLERVAFKASIERDREQIETEDYLEYQAEITNDQYVFVNCLKHLLALGRTETLKEFAALAENLYRTEPTFTTEVYDALSKRMTTAFNRMLKKQFFMDVAIDDFFQDYPETPKYLVDRFGDMMVEKIDAQSKKLIRRVTSVLQGESLTAYIHQNIPEDVREKYPEPAVLCERYSVTQVPWSIHQINRVWRLEGLVSQIHAKPLHDVLTSIFARTMSNGCDEHVIWTTDGSKIFAYRSPISDSDFVITTDSPDFIATIDERRFEI
jgi:hypothetical protein